MRRKMKGVIIASTIMFSLAITIIVPENIFNIAEAQAINETSEYTSEDNPIKPSEAPSDYIINFKDFELKESIIKALNLNKEDVTKDDISKLSILNFKLSERREISLEGLQYASNLRRLNITGGKYTDGIMGPLKSINLKFLGLNDFELEKIPEIPELKNISDLSFTNNKIKDISNILYYSNLKLIVLNYNLIDNIDVFSGYSKLETIAMEGNEIEDLSPLIDSSGSLNLVDFRKNKVNNEGLANLFKDREFPKLERRDIRLSQNRITDFSSLDKTRPQNIWQGKQYIVMPIEEKEFSITLKSFNRIAKEYSVTSKQLDETEDLTVIDEDKYSLNDSSLNKDIVHVYWDKLGFDGPEASPSEIRFSGLLEIVNLLPLKNILEEAETTKKTSDVKKAMDKISYLRSETKSHMTEELSQKLNAIEDRIKAIETGEYSSLINPIPESKASDDLRVNFQDEGFENMVKNAVKRTTGNKPEQVTVGDMRKLTSLNAFQDGEVINNTVPIRFRSLEGIQYAVNITGINVFLVDPLLDSKYDTDGKLISVTNHFQEKYGSDGNTYTRNAYRSWDEKVFKDIEEMHTGILKPMSGLSRLEDILFNSGSIGSKDFEDIQSLKNIKSIQSYSTFIIDLTIFSKFENLESLSLGGNFVKNVEPINNNLKLKKLSLPNNRIDDWTALEHLPVLEELNLNEVIVNINRDQISKNLESISKISSLKKLKLGRNFLENISPLSKLENLTTLDLMYNHIIDLSTINNIADNFKPGIHSSPSLSAYGQEYIVVLDNGNYEFEAKIKDIRKGSVSLSLKAPKDIEVSYIGEQKYRLTNKNSIIETREWDASTHGNSFRGYFNIINKNKIRELVDRAKEDPTERNILSAKEALKALQYIIIEKNYMETSLIELEALESQINAESITLDKQSISLKVGETENLTVTVKPDNSTQKELEWTSSDDKIATVDASGNIKAVAEGKAEITVKVKGTDITDKAVVTVSKADETETVAPISVKLNSNEVDLDKGDTYKFTAKISPSNSTEKDIIWTSSDASVAKVDGSGLVEAVGEGRATITSRIKNTEIKDTAEVNVKDKKETKAESIARLCRKISVNYRILEYNNFFRGR